MRLTKETLKQLIKEELEALIERDMDTEAALKAWATHRAPAKGTSEQTGHYDVNGGRAVISYKGYLYYGSSEVPGWRKVTSTIPFPALRVSMINVNPPSDAEAMKKSPSRADRFLKNLEQ